jgi:biopolymer transport protein ExbB
MVKTARAWQRCGAAAGLGIAAMLMLPAVCLAQAPAASPPVAGSKAPAAAPAVVAPTAPPPSQNTNPAPAATQPPASPPVAGSSPPAKAPTAAAPTLQAPTQTAAPAPSQPNTAPEPSTDVLLKLPRDLSPWGMFMAADIVVKAVMVLLAIASVLTWTIWLAKAIELMAARRRLRRAIVALNEARSLADAMARLKGKSADALALARAAEAEVRLSAGCLSSEGVKERIASRLERLEAAAGRRMIRGTGLLATVGATAPFVGLFGTVWGIMNSFIGISRQHTTNLAIVAPGIAQALLATAFGLVAAIPAVVMYNMFSRWNAGYRAMHADLSAEILRLVSRDLDRGVFDHAPAERRAAAAE